MGVSEKDVKKLMKVHVSFAEEMLEKHGEFYPFGAAMRPNKSIISVSVSDEDDHPDPQTLIDGLNEAFRNGAEQGEYDATALFYGGRVKLSEHLDSSDAIVVQLDHRDKISTRTYLPFEMKTVGLIKRRRQLVFGQMMNELGDFDIFTSED